MMVKYDHCCKLTVTTRKPNLTIVRIYKKAQHLRAKVQMLPCCLQKPNSQSLARLPASTPRCSSRVATSRLCGELLLTRPGPGSIRTILHFTPLFSIDSKVIYFFTVYEWTSIPYQVGYISGYTLLLKLYVHYLDNWIIYEYTSTKVIKCNLHNCMCYYNHKND